APDGRLRAAPLYYGMLMFAQAGRGSLVPARVDAGPSGLSAFALRGDNGNMRVCLVNKETHGIIHARVASGLRLSAVSVLRLTGPAIDATEGVTLGRASVDDGGRWAPTRREAVERSDGDAVLNVPAASAALVELSA